MSKEEHWNCCLEYDKPDTGIYYTDDHGLEVFVGGSEKSPMKLLFNDVDDYGLYHMTAFYDDGTEKKVTWDYVHKRCFALEQWCEGEINDYFESLETDEVDRKIKQRME